MFKPESTTIPLFSKDKGHFRNVPLNSEGQIDSGIQNKIKDFLLDREHDLEEFAAKRLTEEQQSKITEITNFLTGKSSSSFNNSKQESKPTSSDFEFEDNFSSGSTDVDEDEDDFFSNLKLIL
jgi:hypothetical protein